jgi:hypothetical protein
MAARSLAALAAVLAALLAPTATAAPPSASASSCTTVAQGPFLSVDVVIPNTAVQCNAAERRLHVETQLTRDGAVVASASRTCRNASVCRLTVDASAADAPGDQLWCTSAKGYVGSTFVAEAKSCESDTF